MTMSIRVALLCFAGLLIGAVLGGLVLGTACGSDTNARPTATPEPAATPTAFVAGTATPSAPIEYVRVAYINLMSPIADGEGSVAWMTYGDRIDLTIANLDNFDADLVGFSEAAWVKGLEENAWKRLQNGLALEPSILARANPWPFNTSQEESDALVLREGYEEGEYLLSRYPILSSARYALTRESVEEGRAVLHAVVKLPEPAGEVDVYVTRFAGPFKDAQAVSLLQIITGTHQEERGLIVMGDFESDPGSTVLTTIRDPGLHLEDAFEVAGPGHFTCCRASVTADAAPTTAETTEPATSEPDTGTPPATEEHQQPSTISTRWDYILAGQWSTQSVTLLGDEPAPNPQGELLYPSDHNGIGAVFYVGTAAQ